MHWKLLRTDPASIVVFAGWLQEKTSTPAIHMAALGMCRSARLRGSLRNKFWSRSAELGGRVRNEWMCVDVARVQWRNYNFWNWLFSLKKGGICAYRNSRSLDCILLGDWNRYMAHDTRLHPLLEAHPCFQNTWISISRIHHWNVLLVKECGLCAQFRIWSFPSHTLLP